MYVVVYVCNEFVALLIYGAMDVELMIESIASSKKWRSDQTAEEEIQLNEDDLFFLFLPLAFQYC